MKDNKLIAEFMGIENTNGLVFQDANTKEFHSIKYHSSWDWLFPVVQKIGNDYYNTPFNELNNKVNTWTLEDTYNAVVEFIKEQNN